MHTSKARLKARDLVMRLGLHDTPPVRLSHLCRLLNARVFEMESRALDGVLLSFLDGGTRKRIIVVNRNIPRTRKRYTVAHEIGHLILHHAPVQFLRTNAPVVDSAREAEANAFASELFMPIQAVRRIVPVQRNLHRLAETFAVSTEAMLWRLKDLDLLDFIQP